jgi:predicted DNA-binding ribbon-helix-helix protein
MARKKTVKSISMDDAFYKRIARYARRKHMSASGWLSQAAEEKLERESIVVRGHSPTNNSHKKKA